MTELLPEGISIPVEAEPQGFDASSDEIWDHHEVGRLVLRDLVQALEEGLLIERFPSLPVGEGPVVQGPVGELADILFELGYSVNNEEVLLKNGL